MAKFVVVGAGAAGFFAAINIKDKRPDLEVILLEGSRRALTKVKISGGGRCNVTHNCFDPKELVKNYPRGYRELLGPFSRFQPQDTINWFESRGVSIKGEADGRMFPTTNSSQTIIDCLTGEADKLGIDFRKGALVKSIEMEGHKFKLQFQKQDELVADYLLLATGGGPQGYKLAQSLGHTIKDPVPSLFTFNAEDPLIDGLSGQSFPEVQLKLYIEGKKKPFEQVGPLLFTHWGMSGPAVLKLSAFAARELFQSDYKARLRLNIIQDNTDRVFEELQGLKKAEARKQTSKTPHFSLTKRFWSRCLELSSINGESPWADCDNKSLRKLAEILTDYSIQVLGKGQFKEEFVTCGGVNLKEVDFRTMESKVKSGLFFAGELLNIDGITGGFNFQNAWTTAWIISETLSKK